MKFKEGNERGKERSKLVCMSVEIPEGASVYVRMTVFKPGVGQSKIIQSQNSRFLTPVHLCAANRRCCSGRPRFPSSPDGHAGAPRDAYGSAGSLRREHWWRPWLPVLVSAPPLRNQSLSLAALTSNTVPLTSQTLISSRSRITTITADGVLEVVWDSVLNQNTNICRKLKLMHQFISALRWAIACFLGNMGLCICSPECRP